jgi:hypothetical protein
MRKLTAVLLLSLLACAVWVSGCCPLESDQPCAADGSTDIMHSPLAQLSTLVLHKGNIIVATQLL